MDCSYRVGRNKTFCSLGEVSELPESKSAFPGGAVQIAEIIQSTKGPPLYILDGEVRLKPTEFLIWLSDFRALEEAKLMSGALRRRMPKRGPVTYAETDIFASCAPVAANSDDQGAAKLAS